MDLTCSEWGPVAGSFEHVNERSEFINGYKFLDQLNGCQLIKKDCAA
jgi:hypothetical protein